MSQLLTLIWNCILRAKNAFQQKAVPIHVPMRNFTRWAAVSKCLQCCDNASIVPARKTKVTLWNRPFSSYQQPHLCFLPEHRIEYIALHRLYNTGLKTQHEQNRFVSKAMFSVHQWVQGTAFLNRVSHSQRSKNGPTYESDFFVSRVRVH